MSTRSPMMDRTRRAVPGLWFVAALVAFGLGNAGRTDLPMLNAFIAVCAALMLLGAFVIDPELARERWRRGQTGEDTARLAWIRLLFLARTAHEDGFLRRNLEGYAEYAARVRFRLIPGVW